MPRVLAVDDWAFRKGQRYGTVLVDLERGQPVDLLPDRNANSLKAWLQGNPGVEIISRDRADCYINGATEGAPEAIQVADRFHLVKNLRKSLARLIDRHEKTVRSGFEQLSRDNSDPEPIQQTTHIEADRLPPTRPSLATEKRQQLYNAVIELHQQGVSMREIARRLGIHRETVGKFIHLGAERSQRSYQRTTDPCVDYLWKRWKQGCQNARQLTREIQELGFAVSCYSIRLRVARWRRGLSAESSSLPPDLGKPSSTRLSWLLFKVDSQLTESERTLKSEVFSQCPEIKVGWTVASEFLSLLKTHVEERFADWLNRAVDPSVPRELRRFANGIKRDAAAVLAAIKLPWSNGQAEGQINRLKTVKRQMYGRAGFDLLRLRFLVTI